MSAREAIKAAVAKLETESKNYYQSANEALYTSVGYAVISLAVFTVSSIVVPSKLVPLRELKFLIGLGGGGASSGITLAWGLRQRLERRDKARQIEAQKINLEKLGEMSDLGGETAQSRIANTILELTLRTISAPYEPLEKKLKELTDSVESYERRSHKRAVIYSRFIPALLLTLYLGFIIWQISQLESKKKQLEARNGELGEQIVKAQASIESAKGQLEAINRQIAKAKNSSSSVAFQESLSKIETRTSSLNLKISEAAKELEQSNISKAGVAIVFDPPSNVRATPNGNILCSVRTKTTISIYGSTDDWYYTDVCGSKGVIHRSQIKF